MRLGTFRLRLRILGLVAIGSVPGRLEEGCASLYHRVVVVLDLCSWPSALASPTATRFRCRGDTGACASGSRRRWRPRRAGAPRQVKSGRSWPTQDAGPPPHQRGCRRCVNGLSLGFPCMSLDLVGFSSSIPKSLAFDTWSLAQSFICRS